MLKERLANDPPPPPVKAKTSATDIRSLVVSHWDAVYKLLYRLTRRTHETEDLTQDTFLRALDRLDTFSPGTNLRAWLMRIATNAFLDRKRRKAPDAQPLESEPQAPQSSIPQRIESQELHESVADALANLPDHQRLVFLLRTQEDLPFKEIADTLNITEATARWHMMQARRQLLEQLEGKL